jgi:UDP-N-acetylmuramyl pentapeptide phosphotransferase/UDP-N-acetylglucosamine-1-phosphate transferase
MILAVTIVPDARAQVMMGDAGAIAIGCAVALVIIASSNITLSVTYTLAAVFLNLLAERYSLGKLIADNAVLSKLDGLMGRRS